MRFLLFAALFAVHLHGQEIMPARATGAEYKAHTTLAPDLTLAAEFQGRTVPAPGAAFVLKHYVVIEVALYTRSHDFNTGHFSLKLNGKSPLSAQTPGMVAASLKYSNWENQRQVTATGSVGNAGVILGRDTPASRFPGDRRLPPTPPGTPVKVETFPEMAPWDWVAKLAWEDGPVKGPSGGLLYFPYQGNLAKLKTIELIYNGPGGKTTLTLRGGANAPSGKS